MGWSVEPVTPALALASLKGSGVREIKNSATEHTESTDAEELRTPRRMARPVEPMTLALRSF